jgi:hypothetical protein
VIGCSPLTAILGASEREEDGGLGIRVQPWDSGKFGWSRFDQDVVGVRRWRVRCGLPTNRELSRHFNDLDVYTARCALSACGVASRPTLGNPASRRDARFIAAYSDCR